jgi:hypothetical protein
MTNLTVISVFRHSLSRIVMHVYRHLLVEIFSQNEIFNLSFPFISEEFDFRFF